MKKFQEKNVASPARVVKKTKEFIMPKTTIVTIRKPGATFASLEDALAEFEADHTGNTSLQTAKEANLAAEEDGHMFFMQRKTDENDGFINTRVWSDEWWTENGDQPWPELASGWTRTIS